MNPAIELPLTEIAMGILAVLCTILWWFYRKRDEERGKQIELLFQKHDLDVKELDNLKLLIAKNHYERTDLDIKFEKMEDTFRRGFETLGNKFDRFSEAFTAHISKNGGGQ